MPTSPLRLLVVVAHPHDFTHMAGTCGRHVDQGDAVTVLSVTGGAKVHNEQLDRELRKPVAEQDAKIVGESLEAYRQRKHHELDDACGVFGIRDVRVLPFPDVFLEPAPALDRAIADVILEVRPHVLLCHAPYLSSARGRPDAATNDHRTAGQATGRACALAGRADPESRHVPHRIARTLYMGIEWAYHDWDLVIDITDQVHRRVRAETMFRTQGHTPGFAAKRIEIGAGMVGWNARCAYAEPFLESRSRLDDRIRVSPIERDLAERPVMEQMAAVGRRIDEIPERQDLRR